MKEITENQTNTPPKDSPPEKESDIYKGVRELTTEEYAASKMWLINRQTRRINQRKTSAMRRRRS